MLEKHQTRGGQKLLIAEMDDQHLANTVRFYLNQMKARKALMNNGNGLSEYQARLYEMEPVDVAKAARDNRKALQKLYPYLAECYLRQLPDLAAELADVMDRSTQLVSSNVITLPVVNVSDLLAEVNGNYDDVEDFPF